MRFTREEFDAMVQELLFSESGMSDTLCVIVEKTLRPKVRYWCQTEEHLRNRKFEDDIMQEIHLRLMKKTVTHFLLRDDIEGLYNNDPEGFEDWLFKVALNIKRDFLNRVRAKDFKTKCLDDTMADDVCTIQGGSYEQMARVERLREALAVVLDSDASVYKVLTWLAEYIFILQYNIDKIQANDLVLAEFEDKTLFEMFDMLLCAAETIPWLELTGEQYEKISAALRKKHHEDVLVGEVKYRDFFMKQNGEPSGKKSVSDWMNRMNGILRRKEEAAKAASESQKSSGDQSREEERRRGNGPSDG